MGNNACAILASHRERRQGSSCCGSHLVKSVIPAPVGGYWGGTGGVLEGVELPHPRLCCIARSPCVVGLAHFVLCACNIILEDDFDASHDVNDYLELRDFRTLLPQLCFFVYPSPLSKAALSCFLRVLVFR